MELDRLLPNFDVEKRHERHIAAPSADVWAALMDLDLNDSPAIRALMLARGITRRSLRWPDFERYGFVLLHRDEPREFVLGLAGQPWRLRGGIRSLTPEEFPRFDEPDHALIGWNYVLESETDGTRVITITRVRCTDEASHAKFRRYWRFIGPFSGLIRTQTLRLLDTRAGRGGP